MAQPGPARRAVGARASRPNVLANFDGSVRSGSGVPKDESNDVCLGRRRRQDFSECAAVSSAEMALLVSSALSLRRLLGVLCGEWACEHDVRCRQ